MAIPRNEIKYSYDEEAIYNMDNQELSEAIKEAFFMTGKTTPNSEAEKDVYNHFKELLNIQLTRACMITMKGEGK
jgi:endonuclease III-like uncharacterized protein